MRAGGKTVIKKKFKFSFKSIKIANIFNKVNN